MSISPGQRSGDGEGVAPGVLTEADRALLLAMRAWAHECRRPDGAGLEGEHDFILRFWDWLESGWVRRLCDAWDRGQKAGDGMAAARAIETLREMHVATVEASIPSCAPELDGPGVAGGITGGAAAGRGECSRAAAAIASSRAAARCAGHHAGPRCPTDSSASG